MLKCWKYYQKLHRSQNNKNVAKRLESTTIIIRLICHSIYLEIFNPIQLTDVSYCSDISHLHCRNLHVDELFSTYSTELLKESGSFMSGICN